MLTTSDLHPWTHGVINQALPMPNDDTMTAADGDKENAPKIGDKEVWKDALETQAGDLASSPAQELDPLPPSISQFSKILLKARRMS